MSLYEKLLAIQSELKAPKSQYNKFGGYNYRNCEDILEAVKPLLINHKATIIIFDELILIGQRYYIKATAKLIDVENGESIESFAFAREEESKKGMDGSQITGSSSSYARKYALNGLFAIDDTKDSDTLNQGEKTPKDSDTPKQIEKKSKHKEDPVITDNEVICPVCGKIVQPVTFKNGRAVNPNDFITAYGMCPDCCKEKKGK